MNLGLGGDDEATVLRNRARLLGVLPRAPCWLQQVHGANVVDAAVAPVLARADAAFAVRAGVVCAVLVADCLPVLLADAGGRGVAAAHAGWRGLAGGVIQNAVAALRGALGDDRAQVLAYLGPAIGPAQFVVGGEVLAAMERRLPDARVAFAPEPPAQPDAGAAAIAEAAPRYRADLFLLARQALAQVGVSDVYGGQDCTASDPGRFYSFRRDRITGRHGAFIWIQGGDLSL
jgi:YfiH family protein